MTVSRSYSGSATRTRSREPALSRGYSAVSCQRQMRQRPDLPEGDLTKLKRMERLKNDSVPLLLWIRNANALSGARVESRVFRRFLPETDEAETRPTRRRPHEAKTYGAAQK